MSHVHTYGPSCRLRRRPNDADEDGVPHLNAHFFYSSPLPIDDPLSTVPLPQGSESAFTKHPPRPFSVDDNGALEEAWIGLSSKHQDSETSKWAAQTNVLNSRKTLTQGKKDIGTLGACLEEHSLAQSSSLCPCQERVASDSVPNLPSSHLRSRPLEMLQENQDSGRRIASHKAITGGSHIHSGFAHIVTSQRKKSECCEGLKGDESRSRESSFGCTFVPSEDGSNSLPSLTTRGHVETMKHLSGNDVANEQIRTGGYAGTTGSPFLKYSIVSKSHCVIPQADHSSLGKIEGVYSDGATRRDEASTSEPEATEVLGCNASRNKEYQAEVPVGISRLHFISLPALKMIPMYWSPVHDIAAVTRGTWFYKDTMFPVEPAVANQLEYGYRELRPWSQTWSDELNSAIEVGAVGEEKIVYRLWPKEGDKSDSRNAVRHKIINASDPFCAATCFRGEVAAEGTIELEDQKFSEIRTIAKKYSTAQVIFKDSRLAFILKPAVHPSAYYGRKPLQKIMGGTNVGICVRRGFDWKVWEKLHPTKKSIVTKRVEESAPVTADAGVGTHECCLACRSQGHRPKVTDLILVIHGIGQKLSERVESFHFTHAINEFRRSVNVEVTNEGVQQIIRPDFGGIMVLPVNWRSKLSFEDGGPHKEGSKAHAESNFTLKDITPETIPAVRNLISDVMLDIPFYMSQHKAKMIQALISEANRVYRLWCKNNAEFHRQGRVHLIAHSLGSAMAVEVLSKQPTSVRKVDLQSDEVNSQYFEFNTTNLFFVGSPAGFFLLLDKGQLLPRKDRDKPGAQSGDDQNREITGDAPTFGCLAVDNLYNIIASNDPISYRLNATVDRQYASSLKDARVPSATLGFFESIGHAMRSITPGISMPSDLAAAQVTRPSIQTRLPSSLEMEVHDFTHEEIAETKFYMLNDNGQVDWFLSSGGGPLDIQYINMLGAHSSYWASQDFVRMVVIEVGRRPGRDHALPNMKAVKTVLKS